MYIVHVLDICTVYTLYCIEQIWNGPADNMQYASTINTDRNTSKPRIFVNWEGERDLLKEYQRSLKGRQHVVFIENLKMRSAPPTVRLSPGSGFLVKF
jgi:hypothetical protein